MKAKTIAIVTLCACTVFAVAQDGNYGSAGATMHTNMLVAAAAVTTTTTETTTTTDGNTTKVTRTTTSVTRDTPPLPAEAITPENGNYTYAVYDGVLLPYYKGYYFIDGVWVWRGPGKPPIPPPRFRPILPARNPKAAPVKPAPVKRAPVKSAPRRGGRAAGPRPPR